MIQSDGYFGGDSHSTIFRNWATGWTESWADYNSKPIQLAHRSYFNSVVANVVGHTNFTFDEYIHTNHANGVGYDWSRAYDFGFPSAGNDDFTNYHPPNNVEADNVDLYVTTRTRLHNNWDSKNGAIIYDAGIADHSPADSMYLTSKPGWFGNLTYPPINPTVGYTNLYWDDIPAGYRYLYGTNPPPDAGQSYPYNHTARARLRGIRLRR
jgi:hypothetical protein